STATATAARATHPTNRFDGETDMSYLAVGAAAHSREPGSLGSWVASRVCQQTQGAQSHIDPARGWGEGGMIPPPAPDTLPDFLSFQTASGASDPDPNTSAQGASGGGFGAHATTAMAMTTATATAFSSSRDNGQ
ncbi:unnamed protein product, partial [Discosporangium mesarthrocarpum]